MRKYIIIVILSVLLIATTLRFLYLPISRHINNTFDGYITYLNGSEMKCRVTVEGIHQHYLFRQECKDIFDGTITVNDTVFFDDYTPGIRVVFNNGDEAGYTGYTSSYNGVIEKTGDILLSIEYDVVILSCCYDDENNIETKDETNRCLIIAPAENSSEAKNVLSSLSNTGRLEKFRTWEFN